MEPQSRVVSGSPVPPPTLWSICALGLRDPEFVFYDQLKQVMNAYRVKPAIFDLLLAVCISAYLGMAYTAVQLLGSLQAAGCLLVVLAESSGVGVRTPACGEKAPDSRAGPRVQAPAELKGAEWGGVIMSIMAVLTASPVIVTLGGLFDSPLK
ncbi:hypothetical protein CB1_000413012 [Camelus ferus]|nr:hypothetical protein CB1_000413012 [Camelus ferus]